ncbi:MAG: AAA family ATPase [Candidatus Woesearchaeota archaeon]
MIINSINLRNIRSYVNERINFPEGSILLSGDVGAGKTTILLAIEFALFGILRGEVSGSSLLRNGTESGYVELSLELGGKPIVIKRTLRRSKGSVEQESGEISIDGMRQVLTATELKSRILSLMGYPLELASKSKSLIYRYTVYTPQDEMKRILFEDKESRLDILRRVFFIDKYRRIKDNTTIFIRQLREQLRELEGETADLDYKTKRLNEKKDELAAIEIKLVNASSILKTAKEFVEVVRKKCAEAEAILIKANELKRSFDVLKAELEGVNEQKERTLKEAELLKKQIGELDALLGEGRSEAHKEVISELISKKNQELDRCEKEILTQREHVASLKNQKRLSEDTILKISKLESCPLCLQKVSEEHKKKIMSREETALSKLEKELEEHLKMIENLEKQKREIKAELEALKKKEEEAFAIKLKAESLIEKRQQLSSRLTIIKSLEERARNLSKKISENEVVLKTLQTAREDYEKARKELDFALEKEKWAEVEYGKLLKEKESLVYVVKELEAEVQKKLNAKAKIEQTKQLISWLGENFISMIEAMEKAVMARVHSQFNELFTRWFNLLVDDELIAARLDEEFSPVLEQNGYETPVESLSGGEKTACALAYRLALNKVINDLIHGIQTKDVIILDEPTDGFSNNQLDRMRDVLNQLGLRQIILVSHEEKIESFVEHVIKISKNEHVSQVCV